jgi:hypothetical protein
MIDTLKSTAHSCVNTCICALYPDPENANNSGCRRTKRKGKKKERQNHAVMFMN